MPFPVIELLRAVTGPEQSGGEGRLETTAVDWILETGLGPLLWSQCRSRPHCLSAADAQRAKAADLTARLLSDESFDRLGEMLREARARQVQVVLLKGVSIAQQCYPQRHWRPMRDIDVLVGHEQQAAFEQILRDLGYIQQGHLPAEFFAAHQHSMPFYRADPPCWVEVHTGLFRQDNPAANIPAFRATGLLAQSILFGSEPDIRRLPDALQWVYIALHWAGKLTQVGGLVPVLDCILLAKQPQFDWPGVLAICQHPTAARYVYLMLSYLRRHALIEVPDAVWPGLENGRRSLGMFGESLLHKIVDRHLVLGEPYAGFHSEAMVMVRWETLLGEDPALRKWIKLPWRMLFPPGHRDRYDPRRQLRRLGVFWRHDFDR